MSSNHRPTYLVDLGDLGDVVVAEVVAKIVAVVIIAAVGVIERKLVNSLNQDWSAGCWTPMRCLQLVADSVLAPMDFVRPNGFERRDHGPRVPPVATDFVHRVAH